jgi:hypothetical protein
MPRLRQKRSAKVPTRPDRRADPRGNTKKAQRPPHPGEAERIAERRVRALDLRKAGLPFRSIGHHLGVDVHTAWADVNAELIELREQTKSTAQDVRDLELERCDAMTRGLWPAVEHGDSKGVAAAVRVAERRARLLGLDAPTQSKTELAGGITIETEQSMLARIEKEVAHWSTEDMEAYVALQEQIMVLSERRDAIEAKNKKTTPA